MLRQDVWLQVLIAHLKSCTSSAAFALHRYILYIFPSNLLRNCIPSVISLLETLASSSPGPAAAASYRRPPLALIATCQGSPTIAGHPETRAAEHRSWYFHASLFHVHVSTTLSDWIMHPSMWGSFNFISLLQSLSC